jgi:chloramphenicol 3-O phosphotransferase
LSNGFPTAPGRIVVLNGVPRAGKSSITAALQESSPEAWMDLGVDVQRLMTPPRYQPGVGLRPGEPDHAAAPLVSTFYAGLYESIAAHSKVGLNVVAGLGHYDETILSDCARRLDGLPAMLVGVRCPLEVVMERRAAAPVGTYAVAGKDSSIPPPILRWQEQVHVPGVYDLEVDTSVLTPEECAEAIADRFVTGSFTAFHRLAHHMFP